jgi:hypothetical protein
VTPHTAVANLLAKHGNHGAGRARARAQIAREIGGSIAAQIAQAGRSMRCAVEDHGCLNDGSTCICECHDPEGQQP